MKKILTISILAIMTLVSCQRNIETEKDFSAQKLSLYANDVATKTTLNSDWSVSWNNDDALTVFNAANGTTTYSGRTKFLISNPSQGLFSPAAGEESKLISEGESFDWYVCSPYGEYQSNPGGTKGYTISLKPKQIGYNNNGHIAYDDLMVGKALNVNKGVTPDISLYHVGTLHKITIKNESGVATPITGLVFDASDCGHHITGSFSMNYGSESETPSLNYNSMGSSKAYTSSVEIMKVTSEPDVTPVTYAPIDVNVEPNATIDVYFVTAPFSLTAGKMVKIIIKGGLGDYTIEKPLSQDISFEAGKYNTTTVSYKRPQYVVFTETFGENTVEKEKIATYGKAGLTTAVESHKADYAYSVTGNASIAVAETSNAKINTTDYGFFIKKGAVKLPATSATSDNSAMYIKNITVEPNTTYIFKYNKSKGALSGTGEFDTTTRFKWRKSDTDAWTNVNATTAAGNIEQEFTTGDGVTKIDIGVEATDRVPSGTVTFYPAVDYFTLIKK